MKNMKEKEKKRRFKNITLCSSLLSFFLYSNQVERRRSTMSRIIIIILIIKLFSSTSFLSFNLVYSLNISFVDDVFVVCLSFWCMDRSNGNILCKWQRFFLLLSFDRAQYTCFAFSYMMWILYFFFLYFHLSHRLSSSSSSFFSSLLEKKYYYHKH